MRKLHSKADLLSASVLVLILVLAILVKWDQRRDIRTTSSVMQYQQQLAWNLHASHTVYY